MYEVRSEVIVQGPCFICHHCRALVTVNGEDLMRDTDYPCHGPPIPLSVYFNCPNCKEKNEIETEGWGPVKHHQWKSLNQ
jgi:hypothetical protein